MKCSLRTLALISLFSPFVLFATDREQIDTDVTQEEVATLEEGREIQMNYIYDQYPAIHLPTSAHLLLSISAYGDTLELEDGSLWNVSTYDGRKAMLWRIDEALSITQNTRWFSSYYYRIVNRNTGASIEANLSPQGGPFTNGPNTYYVTEFDFNRGLVTLASPKQITHWEIHPSDISYFRDWDFTQPIPVILGDNNDYNGDTSYRWECILINVKTSKKYIRAHQF
jgi:hypothetical protein